MKIKKDKDREEKMLREVYEKIVEKEYTPAEFAEMTKKESASALVSHSSKYAYAVANALLCRAIKDELKVNFGYFKKATEEWYSSEHKDEKMR